MSTAAAFTFTTKLLLLLLLLLLPLLTLAGDRQPPPPLTLDFYKKTCPQFTDIVQQVVADKQLAIPTTAAGTLRLFFHDCIVGGCDASLLVSSNSFNKAERDNHVNQALPGDAFDLIIRAKTRLELACPGVVSCADIIAESTRDLVSMVGGPFYQIRLGRRDSLTSRASDVPGHVALPNMTMTTIIEMFSAKGFTVQEMVALTGAHTIGFSHCSEFADRIFGFSKNEDHDPSMNPDYVAGLRKLCANWKKDSTIAAFNDPMSPGKFDNTYYLNLQKGIGLLASDQAMAFDTRTKPFVELYAANQSAFFEAFGKAMEKVSMHNVLTGKEGEIRHKCDATNSMQVN